MFLIGIIKLVTIRYIHLLLKGHLENLARKKISKYETVNTTSSDQFQKSLKLFLKIEAGQIKTLGNTQGGI